ncbi:solute carrier family 2, facilitated glucose transporter member 9-like [Latimeria chalumnae]|uniref:solute carrier family 2, facilitated glucose transporter member 9-like n=1 Tax=Latimeria chalumnae TaxID=7897 RepID=UPI00313AAFE0
MANEHLTTSLLGVAVLTSFGSSMLYGFNLAVVNSPAEDIKNFYNETWFLRYGHPMTPSTLTVLYSFTVSIFAIGGLVGSLLVGMLVSRFGRKGTLVNSTVLVFLAGVLMGFSKVINSLEMVIIGRFITGIHSGIALSVVPMYLGEIAPKNLRGFLGLVPSIFICLGVFIAQFLGLHEILGKEEHWPLFLSLVVIPTFIQLLLLPWFPESPRYLLIEKRNIHATISALKWYRQKCNIQAEVEEMQEEQRSLSSMETISVYELLRSHPVRWQVVSVIVINVGMQLSGIDAIWFYTNAIFERAGIPKPQIQYTTVATGAIEVIAGLMGCFTIERLGRRPLLIGGFGIMGISCSGITLSLLLQSVVPWMRYVSVVCVVGIIAGFCIGPAGVPFLMTAELFKQSHRPAAYIVGGSLNWLSNFTVGFVFPFLQMSAGAFCYLVFGGISIIVAIYVYFVIPETKNKTFMEISQMFVFRDRCRFAKISSNDVKMKKYNGYGALENSSLEFDSSRSFP